jgi:uncharacterized protein (DUF1697 family)
LDVVNVGAAGTFVVRSSAAQAAVRAELCRRMAVECELMIVPAREVLGLLHDDPFAKLGAVGEVTPYVTILSARPRTPRSVPIEQPARNEWQVKVVAVIGRFVLSLHRRMGKRLIYPNEVIERRFGVPATTRNWKTILTIGEVLRP